MESLENRIVLDSTVVFNEVMYNPLGDVDDKAEYIELYNQLRVDMDISEWVLTGGVEYTFPDGTIVPGRGYLLVAGNPEGLAETAGVRGALGPWTGQLSNAGEELQLYNNDGRLMNVLDYDDMADFPAAADGTGASLSKFDKFTASHVASNWTHSLEIGGTPGTENFVLPGTFRSEIITPEKSPVTAMVPSNGELGTSWTAPDFDDSGWTTGRSGVGHDTRSTYEPFFGLDLDEPPDGQTPIPAQDVNGSVYIRMPFTVDDPASYDRLSLRMRYDDGFVAYINGVEVASDNAPGRDGDTGALTWDAIATGSHSDRLATSFESFDISDHINALRAGDNVLAIHGMNRDVGDSDLLFDAMVVGEIELIPVERVPLAFNEVSGATAEEFFVELVNTGDQEVDLAGIKISSTDNVGEYVFTEQKLAPGGLLALNQSELGFRPADTERITIYSADQRGVIDGQRVTGRLRGRSEQHDGDWLYPSAATMGAANTFQFEDDIVINEIMYNPHPELTIPDTPPQFEFAQIVGFDAEWRYNASGIKLGSDWHTQTYEAGNDNWMQGPGPFGAERSDLPVPIATEFIEPNDNDPWFATYYFQTDFELTAEALAATDTLELSHMIDDGVVIYLNGHQILSFNMPDEFDADTTTPSSLRLAELVGPDTVASEHLQVGKNTLSAEVHVRSASDSDIVFGAELSRGTQTSDFIPGRPYREREEAEWIELYNKGTETVDLTGWRIEDGIRFEFPDGTKLDAGQYLLVAKDAEYLKQQYPDLNIVGGFSGQLSDHDDRLLLLDAQNNPADDVHYYEGGRWSSLADGGAVSLELIDPNSDNNKAESWSVSDDANESEWITHSFRGRSLEDIFGRALFNEFVFGLLSEGEFLIDDIQVIHDPSGDATPLIQNGTFENDTLGESPDKWRIIGNHSGTVVDDPVNPGNKVLHVVATGAQAHVHDHAETTFVDNTRIRDGSTYEISFRAKWLTGNRQLNSRLWFSRLSNTVYLDAPDRPGTPGAQNTSFQENIGPTYADFGHGPTLPQENEEVTVRVRAEDPDGVSSVKLWWRKDEEAWNSSDMSLEAGVYQGVIPGQESRDIVQFYVEAQDGKGAISTFPAKGPDSRALFQVDAGEGPNSPIDTFRIIMMEEENDKFFDQTNRMSNWFLPVTVLHNDKAFYDVNARQIGSRWIRPNSGYKIALHPDNLFYGVHDSIRFDLNGLAEIVMKQMLNRAGGSKSSAYDDISYLVAPNRGHNHEILLQLARYENVYLDEQFENGSDGTKYELDDVTVPTQPRGGPEGLKSGTEVNTGRDIGGNRNLTRQQGDNPEFYRAHVLIKSNRAKDDFQSIVRMAQAIHTDGMELFERSNEVMDIDLWMRHYAHQSYFGNWDTYGFGRPKNLRMFTRPSDGRVIPLMWDCDLCNFTDAIKKRSEPTSRLDEIRDIPHNLRTYWGHLLDFTNVGFTEEYVARWAAHYGELANSQTHGGDETFSSITTSTARRNERVMSDLLRDIPEIDFQITSNGGEDFEVDEATVLLEGNGWVDVREMRLAGTNTALDVFWPEADGWQLQLPLTKGVNEIALEAYDFRGNLIASDTINVTSTTSDTISDSLRVSEVHFNPLDPTPQEIEAGFGDADDFEFIELVNVGQSPISLADVSLAQVDVGNGDEGVEFSFAGGSVQELAPGASVLVVEDMEAFRFRYGNELPAAGQWSGGLGNGGETITVKLLGSVLQQFTYDDGWYAETDGAGRSLQIVDPAHPDLASWNLATSWRPSGRIGGTPGSSEPAPGDSNMDGRFNSSDLTLTFQAGEYEDAIANNSTFSEGDWNGDGDFTSADLVWVFKFGRYETDDGAAARAHQLATLTITADDLQPQPTLGLHRPSLRSANPVATEEPATRRVRLDNQAVDAVFDGPVFDGPVFDGPVFDGPVFDGAVFDGAAFDDAGERELDLLADRTIDDLPLDEL